MESDSSKCSSGMGKYCMYFLDESNEPGKQKKIKICEHRNIEHYADAERPITNIEEPEDDKMDLD